jgi:hypothetical protein
LSVSQTFAHLFDAAVDVTEMRFHFLYGLTVQRDEQVQYPVCRRMLRSNIDNKVAGFGLAYCFQRVGFFAAKYTKESNKSGRTVENYSKIVTSGLIDIQIIAVLPRPKNTCFSPDEIMNLVSLIFGFNLPSIAIGFTLFIRAIRREGHK